MRWVLRGAFFYSLHTFQLFCELLMKLSCMCQFELFAMLAIVRSPTESQLTASGIFTTPQLSLFSALINVGAIIGSFFFFFFSCTVFMQKIYVIASCNVAINSRTNATPQLSGFLLFT